MDNVTDLADSEPNPKPIARKLQINLPHAQRLIFCLIPMGMKINRPWQLMMSCL